MFPTLIVLFACGSQTPQHFTMQDTGPDPVIEASYAESIADLERERVVLAQRWAQARPEERGEVLLTARETVENAVIDELIPAWYGTPWDFYGTSETPRRGRIACGYFVSTVLRDAGFEVERVKMAQQASELIIKTMSSKEAISRYRRETPAHVADAVANHGDGLYIVGLDFHVGFLVVEDETVQMCHSFPGGVRCEDAEDAAAFVSQYRVVGPVLEDQTLERWLERESFTTVLR